MTELIHYQPGKAFYDSFQGARGNTLAKLAITGEGEQRKSALADLYGLDPSLASRKVSRSRIVGQHDGCAIGYGGEEDKGVATLGAIGRVRCR